MLTSLTYTKYDNSHLGEKGSLCMVGGIYSNQKCPICGSTFKDNRRNNLICLQHPQIHPTKYEVLFRGVSIGIFQAMRKPLGS